MTGADVRRAIARKRDGAELDAATWHALVAAYLADDADDAQFAALMMACVLRGLTFGETRALTEAFVRSGETLAAPDLRAVDKHSSGGVGDTVSLIVVPLVAACGVPVAKLSGRALGHTGGTLDKLEAIDGVRTDLSPERFFACVREAGCAIGAQSARLVPADQRIYALRDRTSTVPSRGLIAASIVSKKVAGGAAGIAFDVKAGAGAFVAGVDDARELAQTLVDLAAAFGRRSCAVVSDMNEPLGPAIGTGLEAREARDFLRGERRDARLAACCEALALALLRVAGEDAGGAGRERVRSALDGGAAYARFDAMVRAQGATRGALDALAPHASEATVRAPRSGFVAAIDAVALGERARDLVERDGPRAGIVVGARTGDAIRAGAPLATVYGDAVQADAVARAFRIADEPPAPRSLIYGEIGSRCATPGEAGTRSTLESR